MEESVKMISFNKKQLLDLNNALARYESFCDNCISAFKNTGHDEHYYKLKGRIKRLMEKLQQNIMTFDGDDNEH